MWVSLIPAVSLALGTRNGCCSTRPHLGVGPGMDPSGVSRGQVIPSSTGCSGQSKQSPASP